ncbi:MAG: DUF3189 family protein [Firmicutes bacterium]|nr:DUF3189 family protein [Bacillota bacterium]
MSVIRFSYAKPTVVKSPDDKRVQMKVVYYCYGGTHSSVTAASLHLGLLAKNRLPTAQELLSCPYFDRLTARDYGKIFFMGRDSRGCEVYVMGCRDAGLLVETALKEFCRIMQVNNRPVTLVNTKPCLNILMRVGGFLSRRLNLITLGRLFLFPGIRLAFKQIGRVVDAVKIKGE